MTLHPSIAAVRLPVRSTLAACEPGDVVAVACSGGADSVALASAAVFEGHKLGLRIVGVTLDHGLQTGSAEQADRVVATLSGGQRSRVSLAVALLSRPDVLVLDEPTVGLDPVLRRDLWQLFHELAADGCCLVVSSHVMDEAERCDRLLLMREGRLLAEATPADLLARTGATSVEAAFLALVEGAA